MDVGGDIVFPPFRLDLINDRLWRGAQEVVLRPKTFAVLRHLVHHAGRVVKKEELLDALWPGTIVGDDGIMVCVRELRRALGDDSQEPQFIETLRKRGYRFIAPVAADAAPVSRSTLHASRQETAEKTALNGRDPEPLENRNEKPETLLVGRTPELAQLQQLLEKAVRGERQVVFVSGETGIGKTTLVDAFLAQIHDRAEVRITSGQCVEQYGPGEAYLPLLEATARLCRAPGGERRIAALQRYAPSWLAQLPSLLEPQEFDRLQQRVQGTSRERMLREMAEAAEGFAATRVVVLVLEDLHWSDVSTLDWVTYMARRREPARLLVLGTYRPADVLASNHPLHGVVQELQARGQCEVLRLAPLAEEAIAEYLAVRLNADIEARHVVPLQFIPLLHHRTGGNPLFLVNTVDDLIRQGVFAEEAGQQTFRADAVKTISESIPDTLRQLIERQLERLLEPEQRLLEAASVVGVEFAAAEVAAGLLTEQDNIEATCERLARTGQWLRAAGAAEWPDGTISGRYSFLHAVHHEVVYAQLAEVRRVQLHRRIAARKETAYGERVSEIAAELAAHFAAGRDLQRAVTYSRQAAETAVRRHAHQEATAHLTKGLELLRALPDTAEQVRQELGLQVMLAASLMTLKGYAAAEVEQAYARAQALCQQVETTPHVFPVLRGLVSFYQVRARLQIARELGEQLLHLCQRVDDPLLHVQAHYGQGVTLFDLAEFDSSSAHLTHTLTLYTPQQHTAHVSLYGGYDPGVACLQWLARILWLRGYPTQAKQRSDEALHLARELGHPLSLAWAWNIAAVIHQYRGEEPAAQACVQEAVSIVQEHELAFMAALTMILQGWGLVGQGQRIKGIEKIREGLTAYQSTGAALSLPAQFSLLAGAYARSGQMVEAQRLITEAVAITTKTGERWFEAELYRLKGELTLYQQSTVDSQKSKVPNTQRPTPDAQAEVEAYFLKALEIARQQQAKSWELRAAMSLARLWHSQGKISDARQLLEETYSWFTEGFDTKDLRDAKTLLVSLGGKGETPGDRERATETRGQGTGNSSLESGVQRPASQKIQALQSEISSTHHVPRTTQARDPQPSALSLKDIALFRCEGEYWTLSFAGITCRLKEARGLHYIAHLLQHPHQEFHVLTLTSARASLSEETAETQSFQDLNLSFDHIEGRSDAGEVLDPQARAAYKQRLAELRGELAEAQAFHDLGRSEHLTAEIDFLTHELTRAFGLGGRARRVGAPTERARVNITRAIKIALRKIAEHHPALGQHLAVTIKTGVYCSYTPDPRLPITWQG
jgi:DNA-binding winged helix-turn-helix (wHTH) protein/predicted ATPase/type II secretory pathway predicted ATPase ExeA